MWLKAKLRELNGEGITILISSHDLKHVTEICSRILLLEEGHIVQDTPTDADTLIELEEYFKI
jgi:ABC-2 type transport system ATP-binding protein